MSTLRGGWRGGPPRGPRGHSLRGRGDGAAGRLAGSTDPRLKKTDGQVQVAGQGQDTTTWRGKQKKPVPPGKKRRKSESSVSNDEPTPQPVRQATPQPIPKAIQGNIEKLWQELKTRRIKEKEDAIARGLMDDPTKPKRLEDAITFRGTCQTMCPEFERVSRIYQNGVDKFEKDASGNPIPERFVKRFERSSAGREPPLPSDVRPPLVLRKTLDYLIDGILGGPEPLRNTNKFLFDRTRAIRMDLTLQNIGQSDEITIAIDCFERICRLHIVSLHQMLDPKNSSVQFSEPQEREQLLGTLISIMQSYADAKLQGFPCENEAEFRSIYIIAYMGVADVEWEAQRWDPAVFHDGRVQTALELYAAWQNCNDSKSPLDKISRTITPEIAQNSFARFWSALKSSRVSYLMACMAEIHFNHLRKMALSAIIIGCKTRASVSDWTMSELMVVLGLDDEDQAQNFCELYGLRVKEREDGESYLVLKDAVLTDPIPPPPPIFSQSIVEAKRHNRTLPAIVRGCTVRQARKLGLIQRPTLDPAAAEFKPNSHDSDSMFVSDDEDEAGRISGISSIDSQRGFTATSQMNQANGFLGNATGAATPQGGFFGISTNPGASTPSAAGVKFPSGLATQGGIFSTSNNASTSAFGQPSVLPTQGSALNNTSPFSFGKPSAEASTPNNTSSFGLRPPSGISAAPAQSNNTPPFPFGQPSGNLNQPSPFNNKTSSPFGKPSGIFNQGASPNATTGTQINNPFGFPSQGATTISKAQVTSAGDSTSAKPSAVPGGNSQGFSQPFATSSVFQPAFNNSPNNSSQPGTSSGIVKSNGGFNPISFTANNAGSTPTAVEAAPGFSTAAPRQSESSYGGFIVDSNFSTKTTATPTAFTGGSQFGLIGEPQAKSPAVAPTTNGTTVPTAQMTPHSSSPASSFQFKLPGEAKPTAPQSQALPGQSQQGAPLGSATSPMSSIFAKPKTDAPKVQQQQLPAFQPIPAPSVLPQPKPSPITQQKSLPSFETTPPVFNFASASPARKVSNATPSSESVPKQPATKASSDVISSSPLKSNKSAQKPQSSQSTSAPQQAPKQGSTSKQISDEFADWFLWGKDGIYDQLFEHSFPAIAANAKRQLRDENDRRLADNFRERKLMQRYFYRWREAAYRKRLRRRGRQHRAKGSAQSKSQDLQWTPVQFRPGADMTVEAALSQTVEAKKVIYKTVPLTDIFMEPVQRAFAEASVPEGRWSLFAVSSDSKTDYWWQNKFGLYNGEETSEGRIVSATLDWSTFVAFPRATTPELFTDVGCVIFGCSVDYSLSNTDRFRKDRENLHDTMKYICSNSRYQNIALLVVCYRSPLDNTDLSFKDVDMDRSGPKGRQERVLATREALDFKSLPENVIGRNLIIVDSKGDLDLAPSVVPLTKLVLATINPDLAKEKVQRPKGWLGISGRALPLTTTTVLLGPKKNGMGKQAQNPSRNSSIARSDGSKKRPGPDRDADNAPNVGSRSPKRSRNGDHQMSPPSSHRRSLPSNFRGGNAPADEVLMKWRRLRDEAESPYAKSVNTPGSSHKRSQTLGNGSLLGNSLHLRGQQQVSPYSSSSRASSLLSSSSSQFHRGPRDKTNTDYFRLKARGIEKLPNGNVVPAVFKELSKKRTLETSSSMDVADKPAQKKVQVQSKVASEEVELVSGVSGPKRKKTELEEDEELFAEARKVMGAMSEGMEFYREETRRIMSRSGSRSVSGSGEPNVRW